MKEENKVVSFEGVDLYRGDCLEVMRTLPDKSVNLIVIDPPYNIGKDKRWDKWKTVNAYVAFMGEVFLECQRLLKDNGSFYFFHNDFLQIVELQNWLNKNSKFVFKQLITITKSNNSFIKDLYGSQEHFRNYININEYCLYYTFQDETGLTTIMLDVNNFSNLRRYFKEMQEFLNVNKKQIIEQVGQSADHCFRWGSSQWALPTEKTYDKLIEEFNINLWDEFKSYEELRNKYEELCNKYEELRYTFNEKSGEVNTWEFNFKSKNKYKHPTQKPILLIEKILKASSHEGDVVLDCFLGSGTTAVACVNTNRRCIGIERDDKYFDVSCTRVDEAINKPDAELF